MKTKTWDKILNGPFAKHAVEAALCTIYGNQTSEEQSAGVTKVDNGIGFNGADSKFGTSLAEWVINSGRKPGERLTQGQFEKAKVMMRKYHNQLDERDVLPSEELFQLPNTLNHELKTMVHGIELGTLFDWEAYLEEDPTAGDKLVTSLKELIQFEITRLNDKRF